MQQIAWQLSIFFIAVIILVFGFVLLRAGNREEYTKIQKKGYRIRNIYFLIILMILVAFTALSISDLPYDKPAKASGTSIVIHAVGYQFGWELSDNNALVGQIVEFVVTSKDVNHGFGLYDENLKLVAQTQAMPGYTNKLYYKFTKPGTYQILCLEYCGVSHHDMVAEFVVSSKNQ